MRLLFCAFDSPGHLFPLVGLAMELRGRGCEVAFATGLPAMATLEVAGMERIPRGVQDGPSFRVDSHHRPLSIAIDVKHVEFAMERFGPDVLVTHQLAHAPLLVRERTQVPVAVMGLFSYLWSWSPAPPAEATGLERTRRWRIRSDTAIVNEARALFRMPLLEPEGPDLPFLGDLFMLRTLNELQPELSRLPPQVHAVGACLWEPPCDRQKEWEALQAKFTAADSPLLYVQHGRTFGGPGFWAELVDALADQPVQVVASVGRMDQGIGNVPANFVVAGHVPQGLVLPDARAAVSGGHSSAVAGALTHGIPNVVVSGGGETPDNAETLVRAGCALRLATERLSAETLREAVEEALHGDRLRRNAERLARAFARVPPFVHAADLVDQLAATGARVDRERWGTMEEVAAG